jgi:hypothetical protein
MFHPQAERFRESCRAPYLEIMHTISTFRSTTRAVYGGGNAAARVEFQVVG